MTTEDDAEKAIRIIKLAEVLHAAATALEREDFLAVQRLLGDGARQARVLVLMDKTPPQQSHDGGWLG